MPYNPSPFERDVSPDWRRSPILFLFQKILKGCRPGRRHDWVSEDLALAFKAITRCVCPASHFSWLKGALTVFIGREPLFDRVIQGTWPRCHGSPIKVTLWKTQDLKEKSLSERSLGGSINASLKLKGIDGRAHNKWSLWLLI
ncbi:hypothetical protein M0812_25205 [Anaeramoeba flamelloides]|uniref:Uncharacterized protein n=1 Tax=Anaeramoeba flamelloides TaxID=1746091 RepID=A0AAV7YII6_9EUKA|nr:hypothetical protein M0812_25205 [Anaeramoeba flamelloides]